MRTTPPHQLVRYRHLLLVVAILCLGAGWLVLELTAADDPTRNVFLIFTFIFIWLNGLYWLVILRYPYVEIVPGQYASYDEWKQRDSRSMLVLYFAGAVRINRLYQIRSQWLTQHSTSTASQPVNLGVKHHLGYLMRRLSRWIAINLIGMATYLRAASVLWVRPGEEGTPGGPGDTFYWLFILVPIMVVTKNGSILLQVTAMKFVIEIWDPNTGCIVEDPFFVATSEEVAGLLGEQDFDPHVVYDLEPSDVERLRHRFNFGCQMDGMFARLRPWRIYDDLPYKLHTNRELLLMLSGTKPLASFCGEYPPSPTVEEIPERFFDPYVDVGRFIKREYVEPRPYGRTLGVRWVLYALPAEGWRIDAYILLQQTTRKAGWNEGFERMEGSLLGYAEWQTDAYLELTRKK